VNWGAGDYLQCKVTTGGQTVGVGSTTYVGRGASLAGTLMTIGTLHNAGPQLDL
jgi:hypothetical protein